MKEDEWGYYSAEFVDDICDTAREFLTARDRYIAAFLRWNDCPLGCSTMYDDEAETIGRILKAAWERHNAKPGADIG